jgi:calcineurin-like phosphoesterase family protein
MNNIYIVGDTHGTWTNIIKVINKYDIHNDVVIVAGDFGFIWNGDTKDLVKLQKRFSERNCVLAFVDGNHENFERLYKYPEVKSKK